MISTEVLRRFGFFTGVSEDQLRKVAMIADEEFHPAGTIIFHEGDAADRFYLVLSGEVDVGLKIGTGEPRVVDTIVGNELLGWSAIAEPHTFLFDGTARTDATLLRIDGPKLRALLREEPEVGVPLMLGVCGAMGHRLKNARVQLVGQVT